MLIALDHDRTYTIDPDLWDGFIRQVRMRGGAVVCVTMRPECSPIGRVPEGVLEVLYTSGARKRDYCRVRGYSPDIWIDDRPEFI